MVKINKESTDLSLQDTAQRLNGVFDAITMMEGKHKDLDIEVGSLRNKIAGGIESPDQELPPSQEELVHLLRHLFLNKHYLRGSWTKLAC